MFKSILVSLVLLLGTGAQAMQNSVVIDVLNAQKLLQPATVRPMMLEWTVGDNAQYKIDMGFIQGTMDNRVREATAQGYWLEQDMDMGFAGKQLVEIHINKNTGEIIELRVNGQKQTPPEAGDQEVVDMKEESITVPAGTFDCVYLKIRDNSNNQESEAWLNPQIVPMTGMIKTLAPSQFGQVNVELTGYEKK